MLAGGEIERLERAQDAFVDDVRVDADLAPSGPESGPDRVHAEGCDLGERVVPDRRVRLEEGIPVHRRRHRRRADDRFSGAAAAQRVAIEGQGVARREEIRVEHPEAGRGASQFTCVDSHAVKSRRERTG